MKTRFLGSKYARNAFAAKRPIYVKRNQKVEANVAVSECTVC